MKKILIILILIPVFAFAQTTEELDFVAPLNDGIAAVKKDNKWGFINNKGTIIIPFRGDLVLTETDSYNYPIFKNNRCLISENRKGIEYFGYIDKTGKTIIETKFLNASNFNNNHALVLELTTKIVGENEILKKRMVYYKYFEVVINTQGDIKDYLSDPINVVLDKKFLKKPPRITSKFVSNTLVATLNKNKKWIIKSINL
ncbi:WG repeat-containing protein [Flavivirga rizhaonensis]|uniref:WG repeat-containing protein n=1 Tax=Flavivirga rizhaonensis TaxID=2559571 RepID=A0A4S1E113_9FLAO|nr:WG repeat-containing protein [Flavivirga rizhaonensis]TGV04341.1 WG repeat-containing protein [Flavivirga rizhaonensis]